MKQDLIKTFALICSRHLRLAYIDFSRCKNDLIMSTLDERVLFFFERNIIYIWFMFAKRRGWSFSSKWMSHVIILIKIFFRSIFFFDSTLNEVDVAILDITTKVCTRCKSTICRRSSLTFLSRAFSALRRYTGSSFGLSCEILFKLFTPFPLSI